MEYKLNRKTLFHAILFVCILISFKGKAQTTIYSENFNSGGAYFPASPSTSPYRTLKISGFDRSDGSSYNAWAPFYQPPGYPNKNLNMYVGGSDLVYNTNASCNVVIFENSSINATSYGLVELSFDWTAGGDGVNDYLIAVYSLDGGSSWTDVGSKLGGSPGLPFNSVSNLSLPVGGSNFKIGFRWVNDGSAGDGIGPVIDNIEIVGFTCTPATAYAVSGGGPLCSGETGSITIANSQVDVDYQLLKDGAPVGSPIAGTGSSLSWTGLTAAGVYSVEGTGDGTSYCASDVVMTGSQSISSKPGPTSVDAGAAPAAICVGETTGLTGTADGVPTVGYLIDEGFDSGTLPAGWTIGTVNRWAVTGTSDAGGTANELRAGAYGETYRVYTGLIDATGRTDLSLDFKYFISHFSNSFSFRVETSADASSWTTRWSRTVNNDIPATAQTVDLSALDNSSFYISFTVQSASSVYVNSASVDDIQLSYASELPVTYSWSGGSIQSDGTTATPTVNPNSTTTYTMTATSNGCDVEDDVVVTVNQPNTTILGEVITNNEYLWSGNSNGDWTDPSNWFKRTASGYEVPSTLPTASTNVFIFDDADAGDCISTTHPLVDNVTPVAQEVFLGTNATLEFDGTNTLTVHGDFTNNGTFLPSTGKMIFAGAVAKELKGSSTTDFYNLEINGSGALSLTDNVAIENELKMTQGRIILGNNNVWNKGSLLGGASDSYLDFSGSGILTQDVASLSSYNLPVGSDGVYAPATLTLNSGSLAAASVDVTTRNSVPSALNALNTYRVNRTWQIEPTGISGINYDISLEYNVGELSEAGDETTLLPVKYSGAKWYKPVGSSFTTGTPQGTGSVNTGTKVADWSGLTSFSEFIIVGEAANPLPVEMVKFTSTCNQNNTLLEWETASESNAMDYLIQRSEDGMEWDEIANLQASGNTTTTTNYQFTDKRIGGGLKYYRLLQRDFDGEQTIFGPVSSNCSDLINRASVYPNPSNGQFVLEITSETYEEKAMVSIIDVNGKIVSQRLEELNKGVTKLYYQLNADKGIYIVRIENQNGNFKPLKINIH